MLKKTPEKNQITYFCQVGTHHILLNDTQYPFESWLQRNHPSLQNQNGTRCLSDILHEGGSRDLVCGHCGIAKNNTSESGFKTIVQYCTTREADRKWEDKNNGQLTSWRPRYLCGEEGASGSGREDRTGVESRSISGNLVNTHTQKNPDDVAATEGCGCFYSRVMAYSYTVARPGHRVTCTQWKIETLVNRGYNTRYVTSWTQLRLRQT